MIFSPLPRALQGIYICWVDRFVSLDDEVLCRPPQDWIDVEGVIIRQGNRLHNELILEELTPLVELKEEPEILERLRFLFSAHEPDRQ